MDNTIASNLTNPSIITQHEMTTDTVTLVIQNKVLKFGFH